MRLPFSQIRWTVRQCAVCELNCHKKCAEYCMKEVPCYRCGVCVYVRACDMFGMLFCFTHMHKLVMQVGASKLG